MYKGSEILSIPHAFGTQTKTTTTISYLVFLLFSPLFYTHFFHYQCFSLSSLLFVLKTLKQKKWSAITNSFYLPFSFSTFCFLYFQSPSSKLRKSTQCYFYMQSLFFHIFSYRLLREEQSQKEIVGNSTPENYLSFSHNTKPYI